MLYNILEKTKHLLYQGATASLETIVQPMVVDEIPRDIKPSKQLLLSSNGKLFKPDYTIKVNKHLSHWYTR